MRVFKERLRSATQEVLDKEESQSHTESTDMSGRGAQNRGLALKKQEADIHLRITVREAGRWFHALPDVRRPETGRPWRTRQRHGTRLPLDFGSSCSAQEGVGVIPSQSPATAVGVSIRNRTVCNAWARLPPPPHTHTSPLACCLSRFSPGE